MSKQILLILVLFGPLSSNERIVQLSETHNNVITEVLDVLPAYVFYHVEVHDSDNIQQISYDQEII